MQKYIDAECLLSEARMMWHDCHHAYLLLEGTSDKVFISALMGEIPNVRSRVVNGWENVYETISKAEQTNFPYVAGVIDSDYHEILEDQVKPTLQLFFTDDNDIEMMMVKSHSFEKFLIVCGSCDKLKDIPDKLGRIMEAAFPLGAMRYLSLKKAYNLCFEGIESKKFICKQDLSVDKKRMISVLLDRTRSLGKQLTVSIDDLLEELDDILEKSVASQYCNGHDVLDVISIAMTKLFATCDANTYDQCKVFNYLLMGYTQEEFQTTQLFNSIGVWTTSLEI